MTISWSFSYNSLVKFHGKNIEINNMTVWYPSQCYKELCYKVTALNLYNNYQESPLYNAVLHNAEFGVHKSVPRYRWTVL